MSRLILGHELYGKSESELFALFNTASAELIRSEPGTPERRHRFATSRTKDGRCKLVCERFAFFLLALDQVTIDVERNLNS